MWCLVSRGGCHAKVSFLVHRSGIGGIFSLAASYIFRLDDIAPQMDWARYARLRELFMRYRVRPLIAVIPQNEDPEFSRYENCSVDFWQEIRDRQAAGWHVAQHGYRHVYDTRSSGLLGVSKRSEFAGHSYDEQFRRIKAGKEILERAGVRVSTFVAPSHSFDSNTLKALREAGFTMMSDGFAFYPYYREGLLFVPQLTETPRHCPFGIHTFCLHTNSMSEQMFSIIEEFLEKFHDRVIPFEHAARFVSVGPLHALSGVLARYLLKVKRSITPSVDY